MSLSTIIGLAASFALCVYALVASTNDIGLFFSLPALVLVLGGTMACTFAGFQARYVWLAFAELAHVAIAQRNVRRQLPVEVGRVIRWGFLVKSKGLKALEDEIKKRASPDPYLVYGINMVLSGYDPEAIRSMLTNAAESAFERATVPAAVLRSMASTAPAFGMIGTLVGLAIMLRTMGGDPAALGPSLAVALLTTLYGLLLARLVFLPAATRLQQRAEIDRFRHYVIAEGLGLVAEHQSPHMIQDRMNSYLDPALHVAITPAPQGPERPVTASRPSPVAKPKVAETV
ncbi:MAG: motility protein A [Alphaproteobacteria bacterium]